MYNVLDDMTRKEQKEYLEGKKELKYDRKIHDTLEKPNTWVQIFGVYYLRRLIDEDSNRVLRFNKSLFVQFSYLEEL